MSNQILRIFSVILAMGITTTALAQRQTGSVAGKVTEVKGEPLPGASVTLCGPSLMGTLTFITTTEGDFRFPSVPPGKDYVVTVEMPGFQKVARGGIIVHVGKTVTLIIPLESSAIQEEIIVIAPSPIIDATSSKISINYPQEMIANVPLKRDYYDVIKTGAGIAWDEGQGFAYHRSFSSHGGTMRDNQVALDGINIDNPLTRTNMGGGLSFDIIEEIEFELGFHPPEVGMTGGAYINIVTRSGSNDFHGQASAYFFTKKMTQELIPDSEIEAVGLARSTGYKRWSDYSFSLGGPIIRDKLWFFFNGRYAKWILEGETLPDGPFEVTHQEILTFAKLNFKPSPALKFTGMWSFGNWDDSNLIDMVFIYYNSVRWLPHVDNDQDHTFLALGNWILDQNTFLDMRFNYSRRFIPWKIDPSFSPDTPSIVEMSTGGCLGTWLYNEEFTFHNIRFSSSGTHFVDDFLGGKHQFKAGLEYEKNTLLYDGYQKNPFMLFTYQGLPWGLHNAVPYMGMFQAYQIGAEKGDLVIKPVIRRFSAYLQDSFTIKGRLTLNLGVRYDDSRGDLLGGTYKPAGRNYPVLTMLAPNVFREYTLQDIKNIPVWKDLSPRLGAVFDVFGDRTTSLKASWARYNESLMSGCPLVAGPVKYNRLFFSLWIDLNQNGIIETTDLFIPQYIPPDPLTYNPDNYIDPNLRSPLMDEFIVGLERELFKNFSAGISYCHKRKHRITDDVDKSRGYTPDSEWWLPFTVTEPGWDGILGTPDDAQFTVYGAKADAPESQPFITNVKEAERRYRALEFIFNKRMANRWQLLASVTWSKHEGNVGTSFLETFPATEAFDDPNWFTNRYGRLTHDRPLSIKLQGSVVLPLDIMLSGFYFHVSGSPWARTLRVQLPYDPALENPGGFVDIVRPVDGVHLGINAEAPGMRRTRSRNNLDLRVEKIFKVGNLGTLGIFLDALNVFGENWFDIDQDPGGIIYVDGTFVQWPTCGQFTGAHGTRIFKASIRFIF